MGTMWITCVRVVVLLPRFQIFLWLDFVTFVVMAAKVTVDIVITVSILLPRLWRFL